MSLVKQISHKKDKENSLTQNHIDTVNTIFNNLDINTKLNYDKYKYNKGLNDTTSKTKKDKKLLKVRFKPEVITHYFDKEPV